MVYEPFEKHAKRYDAWFDRFPGNQLFPIEVACLKRAVQGVPRPWLEVGVGTGRFAQALGIDEGVDPAASALDVAKARGIRIKQGAAESLPYPEASFGGVFMIITLCFLDDPLTGIRECCRVLRDDGKFVLGMVPADSPWGHWYGQRKEAGHLFYSEAKFFTIMEAQKLVEKAGFRIEAVWSSLFVPPDQNSYPFSEPRGGIAPNASFVVMRAARL
jgi:ubiquinone/menaquinone biosynthesis C-methylase UbiE